VITYCEKFKEGNERIMGSAYFAIGQIYLEQQKRGEALENFMKVEGILKECLFAKLREKGQTEVETNAPVSKLIQPSIFDDDKIKELKSSLFDV
jgi:hypothetical protein